MRKLIGLIPTLLLSLTLGSHGADLPQAKTMLVVDASGSMWGKVDGEYKIVIARRVISELMADWDPAIPLGLSAYGHNRKGSCDDIETLVVPDTRTGPVIADTVNSLNPMGKTPLTNAVVRAANTLEYRGTPASVVLLTDGEETCDLDPCAMGAALEERGIDFTVYVIGFDVALGDQDGLRCLAETTGGQFIAANNADQLKTALSSISAAVSEKATSITVDPENSSSVTLRALMTQDQPINDSKVQWDVRPVDENGLDDPTRSLRSSGPSLSQRLPPGPFRIYVSYGGAFKYIDIDSVAGEAIDVPVNLDAGRLRITPEANGAEPSAPVTWSVYPLESNREEGRLRDSKSASGSTEFVLNAGLYRVKGELSGYAPLAFDLLIRAGSVADREVSFERP